jgi:acyl-coenzyme A synthetase/AMP-(fatty) acid ligase
MNTKSFIGSQVNAGIVLNKGANATEKDIQEFCKKNLAPFKIPKRIFFADELPRTATGKIQRRIVAEHFLKDTSKESTSG